MTDDRPYWDMEVEPYLNSPRMASLQLEKLKTVLARLKQHAPFQRRMMEQSGLDPETLTGLDEFKDKVEPANKDTWIGLVRECDGDLLRALDQVMPVSVHDLDYIATTTGTTGAPTPYPLTLYDIERVWGTALVRGGWRAGIRSHDRVLFCFALSMVAAGIPTMLGMRPLGATILPVGAEAGSERILMIQALYRGTVFAGTPSLAEYLIEQAPKVLNREAGRLGFKYIMCGGEPGAGIPEVRRRLERAYNCRVFDGGAGFGFSCDHEEYQGMHWLCDDLCLYELLDPETRAPVPLEHGAVGEAHFTTLEGDGVVILRQSMGDIHQVFTEPCPCGRTGFRYKVIGRRDNMLKVKGVMVYPSLLLGVINEFCPRVTGEMRIVLDEQPPRVRPPLRIRVEYAPGVKPQSLSDLAREIEGAMSRRLRVRPRILWAEPGSLERSLYKGRLIERRYQETD